VAKAGSRWVSEARLQDLLEQQTEAFNLDFKSELDIQKDSGHRLTLVKLVAAMTALGGDIIVGVDSHGRPTGKVSERLAQIYDEANLSSILEGFLSAGATVHSQTHPVGGLLVTLVHVEPGAAGPVPLIADGISQDKRGKETFVFRQGQRYIRDGTSNELWIGDEHQVGLLVKLRTTTRSAKPERLREDAIPLDEAVDRYLTTMRRQERTDRTIEDYGGVLRRLAAEHPGFTLADFEPPEGRDRLTRFIERLWAGRTPGTRGKVISVYNSFFDWCANEGLMANDPARLRRPKKRSTRRTTADGKIVEQLIDAQPRQQDRVGIQLLARVGLHKNELRLLRWSDLDLHKAEVRAHGSKRNKGLPITNESLIADLKELWESRRPASTRYVIHPIRGKGSDGREPYEPSSMHRWWEGCRDRLGAASHLTMSGIRNSLPD
jgi:integrase